jgi:ATP-binding cassette subfamily C (CFTR/MRP) protein 1
MYLDVLNYKLGLIPGHLSSSFVFLIFLYAAQFSSKGDLTAARAFTTLSILELLTTPLGTVLKAIPSVTAAVGCLDRIQDYLRLDGQARYTLSFSKNMQLLSPQLPGRLTPNVQGSDLEKSTGLNDKLLPNIVASFEGVTLRYGADSTEVLRDVQLDIGEGSLVMVVGPVGCGKSTLLKALAGDIPPSKGCVRVKYPEVAYCQQTPWLANCTLRESIIGQTVLDDEKWYQTVTTRCALDTDIANLPGGDEWIVGSAGITLSGGQKQRLVCPSLFLRLLQL